MVFTPVVFAVTVSVWLAGPPPANVSEAGENVSPGADGVIVTLAPGSGSAVLKVRFPVVWFRNIVGYAGMLNVELIVSGEAAGVAY